MEMLGKIVGKFLNDNFSNNDWEKISKCWRKLFENQSGLCHDKYTILWTKFNHNPLEFATL